MMPCLLVIIDGCNEDYITKDITPFLYSLKHTSNYISMQVTPSFATRVELFTGKAPESTDTFVDFCLGSAPLPLQLFRVLTPPPKLGASSKLIKLGFLWKFLYYLKHHIWLEDYEHLSLLTALSFAFTGRWIDFGEIPLALLPYFSVNESLAEHKQAEKKGLANNLMGILRSNGFRVNFIYGETETINAKLRNYVPLNKEVIILHYGETDSLGHKHGPNSPEIRQALTRIDTSIKSTYEQFKEHLEFMMIFGDHNMVEVTRSFDLWSELQRLNLKISKDYLLFLNSPLARFWFKNKKAKQKIKAFLMSLNEYGREVSKAELKQQRLPVADKYGELIFWANNGVNFLPDFYHSADIKGMHGYFDPTATTPLIIWSKQKNLAVRKKCTMRDVTPTVLKFLDLKHSGLDGNPVILISE